MAWFCSPLPPGSAAVGLYGGGVDQHLGRRAASLRERLEQFDPDLLGRPAHEAVVERLLRPIDVPRRVGPAATGLQHMDNATDHPPVVYALLAPRVLRQKRCDLRELLVRQLELIHRLLPRKP